VPVSSGSYTVYLNVTDSVEAIAISNNATIIVNGVPSVSISPSSVTLDVGQSQTFSSTVSGGTLPYVYQWYLNSDPVSGANDSTWTFTPASEGSYTVYVNVTDNVNVTAKSNIAHATVNLALSVSISPTSVTMDAGQPQLFTSTVSGGTSSYSYQWYLNGTLVPDATSFSWTFTPSSPGSYNIYVNTTDNAGVRAESNIALDTVNPALSVTISPSSVALDVGQSQLFTSVVSNGTSSYSYQWYLNGSAVSGATGSSWTFVPVSSGSYTVYLNVTDSVEAIAISNNATIIVNGVPSVSISPSSVALDVGQSQLFTSVVSNGTSSYSYQWYLNGSAVSGATGSSWTFVPVSSGSYTVYLNVTDSVGVVAISLVSNVKVIPAIPEFQPPFFLSLFIIATLLATLLAAFILKRKRNVRTR
jgi:hypothetical protein